MPTATAAIKIGIGICLSAPSIRRPIGHRAGDMPKNRREAVAGAEFNLPVSSAQKNPTASP